MTTYGQSAEFSLLANGSVTVPPIILGPTTPIPTGLNVNVEAPVLVSSRATTRTLVMATYANGNQVDVSGTGTSCSVSNPAIATITSAGLITAVSSGTVMIQAINEGAQAITQLRVALSNVDSDGDGIPDEEELRIGTDPNNAADAEVDQDHDGLGAVEEYRSTHAADQTMAPGRQFRLATRLHQHLVQPPPWHPVDRALWREYRSGRRWVQQ